MNGAGRKPTPFTYPDERIELAMSDRTEVLPTVLARALWTLSNLLLSGRVELANVWHESRKIFEAVVRIDVTGYPAEREELLGALPDAEPEEWQSGTRAYRDWRGVLLSMNVVVSETLAEAGAPSQSIPAASDPAATMVWVGGDDEEAVVLPVGPGLSGPGGKFPQQALDMPCEVTSDGWICPPDADPEHVHQTALPEPSSRWETVARTLAPGKSTRELSARYADVPGVVVVPGLNNDEDGLYAAWSRYARAKCLHDFAGRRFATVDAAVTAINLWPGRDMLETTDVLYCAARVCDPDEPPAPRGRLLRFLPRGFHRDGASAIGGM